MAPCAWTLNLAKSKYSIPAPKSDGKTLFVTMNVPDGKGGEITNVAVYERR